MTGNPTHSPPPPEPRDQPLAHSGPSAASGSAGGAGGAGGAGRGAGLGAQPASHCSQRPAASRNGPHLLPAIRAE